MCIVHSVLLCSLCMCFEFPVTVYYSFWTISSSIYSLNLFKLKLHFCLNLVDLVDPGPVLFDPGPVVDTVPVPSQHFSAAGPTASSVFLHSAKASLQAPNSVLIIGVWAIFLHFLTSDNPWSRKIDNTNWLYRFQTLTNFIPTLAVIWFSSYWTLLAILSLSLRKRTQLSKEPSIF